MKNLLIAAHTPTENTQTLGNTLLEAANCAPKDVQSSIFSPFEITQKHLESADGIILFTPENFGYMSGALKDMFDRTYYDIIDSKRGTPYCLIVRAGKDGTGTVRAVESIAKGLGWKRVQSPLILLGDYQEKDFNDQAKALAQGFAQALSAGMV